MDELRGQLAGRAPLDLAARCAVEFTPGRTGQGEFHLAVWGRPVRLAYPDFIACNPAGKEAGLGTQGLVLYYFVTADGAPLAERWISFSELADGRFYNQAFQGYSGGELARHFGNDLAAFAAAAHRLGGEPPGQTWPGDAAFRFQVLPRLPVLVVAWQGDEDFPASYQVLFDAAANHYLPSDVCAITGGMLARKLMQ